jgi:alkanesulfonate monooxygenase SsuD/methylene tetrahydromethanopterin reductase-like flavin-dependent oxidoreductase (luciferase family)
VSRLEEYVEILRRAWRSEAGLSFSGRFYEIDAPAFAVGHDPARLVGLEVCAAGVNEVMIRAAARSCDGVLLHAVTRAEPYFSEHVLPAIATGSRTRDTAPWVAMWVVTAVDESEEEARVAARRTLAFYFSTPSYFSTVEASPWAEPVRRLQERFRAESGLPDWDALGRLLPDEMVDELAVAGTPTHVAARIASLEADLGRCGVREIVLQPAVLGLADRDGAAAYASVIAGCEVSSEIPPMEVHDATV